MKRIFLLLLIILAGCAPLQEYSQTQAKMGTFFTITVFAENSNQANESMKAAFAEIDRIENLMSLYKNDSEVSILNRQGFIDQPSQDLWRVIMVSEGYSDLSHGAFDITCQPLLDLWDQVKVTKRLPTDAQIQETRKLVDYNKIKYGQMRNNISFRETGMKITLGGIAKGYALDRAMDILKENGIKHALVNAGGNILVMGGKPNGEKWSIALKNPRNTSQYITEIFLKDGAVATSGDYERYFMYNATRIHHIMDPRTGYSANKSISATVITKKGVDSDALSTTIFVLGPDEGMNMIEQLDVEGLIISEDREIYRSPGFSRYE
jgi:thiamine biosynthesis lipoprotein